MRRAAATMVPMRVRSWGRVSRPVVGLAAAVPLLLANTGIAFAGGPVEQPLARDQTRVEYAVAAGGSDQFDCSADIKLTRTLVVPAGVTVSISEGANNVTLDGGGVVRVLEVAGNLTSTGVSANRGVALGAHGFPGLNGSPGDDGANGKHRAACSGLQGTNGKSGTSGEDGTDAGAGADARGGRIPVDGGGSVALISNYFYFDGAAGGRYRGNNGASGDGGNGGSRVVPFCCGGTSVCGVKGPTDKSGMVRRTVGGQFRPAR